MAKSLRSICITEIHTSVCAHRGKEGEDSVSCEYHSYSWRWKSDLSYSPDPSGFIFNQITIAKSFLNCIIPNHTIIRAKIQASVWHNCSFWLLLMILKVSTTDALVLSEILLKTQEGPRHLFSGVLFLLLKTRCLKWEQKCNYMDRCYWVQNSLH